MWKLLPTRNWSGTLADFPRAIVIVSGGASVTDGDFIPGESCAAARPPRIKNTAQTFKEMFVIIGHSRRFAGLRRVTFAPVPIPPGTGPFSRIPRSQLSPSDRRLYRPL